MAAEWEAAVVAVITGFAGIVSAAGGVLLIVRSVRDKERKAAKHEYEEVSTELHNEREARVRLEELAYTQRVLLAQNGIALPSGPREVEATPDGPEPEPSGPRGLPALGGRLHDRRAAADDGGDSDIAGGG